MDTDVKIILEIRNAYESGRFEPLFPLMTNDYAHLSFWVLEPVKGKRAAMEYYRGKGAAIRAGGPNIEGRIVRVLQGPASVRPRGARRNGVPQPEDPRFLNRADEGRLAVLLTQQLEEGPVETLAIPEITEDGRLRELLVTTPSLYELEQLEPEQPQF